jgi:aarF domain-containing kinase
MENSRDGTPGASDSSTNTGATTVEQDDGESPEEMIERLHKNIATLSSRCARLEAQNILIPVQQLDIAARATALTLSLVSLYLYARLVFYAVDKLFPLVLQKLGRQPGLILWVIKLSLSVYPYMYNRMTYGITHRRFEVFTIAFIVIARTRLARWRERIFATDPSSSSGNVSSVYGEDCSEDAIWDANYEISARFLYVSILRLKGLWTKTAQYLSSRADFMPVAYVRELKRLQDEAPATDWKDIRLPRKLLEQLTDINPVPIASASIGQVHVARLKLTGEKVVIKVQHPSASTLMMDDFWSLKVIARIVAWMDKEYEFFEILMNEWAKEARHELDFISEANNLLAAKKSIDVMFHKRDVVYTNITAAIPKPVPFQVEIPRPLMHLTSKHYLVMHFCEGGRVDDFDLMEQQGIARDAVMDAVSQTFAHMMYVSDIFNGDPHPGNVFLRAGTTVGKEGFTLVLLDWGLAKRMPTVKRLAFCQMALAAATLDFGLLLDAFEAVGLKMKRENVAEDMEGIRFLLRDVVQGAKSRKRIKAKIKVDQKRMQARKKGEKVPMDSKAYPGEFFFFVRVNDLLHGLGSRLSVEMAYLDVLKPYAECGLIMALKSSQVVTSVPVSVEVKDTELNEKLQIAIKELQDEKKVEGVQICVLDKNGACLADIASGTLGGLKKAFPMQNNALVLGFSCTKAIAATMAHVMVEEGYLDYDEPVCKRVWTKFCSSDKPPVELATALDISQEEVQKRWEWKRSITLRNILMHQAGLWSSMPHTMTIKSLASCESCTAAYEYNPDNPEATLLPSRKPGEESEYHFMSFGWLIAGTLCGAYEQKHGTPCTFKEVYERFLESKLSPDTLKVGFRPCGGSGGLSMAQVVTADIRASRMIQQQREFEAMGEDGAAKDVGVSSEMIKSFRGKEFLLDPRIWNCSIAQEANVPSAGGRFSAMGLARFYHDLGRSGRILDQTTLKMVATTVATTATNNVGALQGATVMTSDVEERRVSFGLGYQVVTFDKSSSGFGHSGVGGSIGLHHPESGLSIGFMTNKADGGAEVTMRISRVIMKHFDL